MTQPGQLDPVSPETALAGQLDPIARKGARDPAGASELVIRPIEPDDKQPLAKGFERLSERSRYRRFLSPHTRLSDAELRYFTEVDHHDHEALVALEAHTRQGIGVARFVRSKEDPASAEVAVAVIDDWQGRGVGGRLAAALADRARAEGISRFSALALSDNEEILNLLRDLGRVHVGPTEQGAVELTVDLPEHGAGDLLHLLRAAARGTIMSTSAHTRRSKGGSPRGGARDDSDERLL